MEHNQIRTPFGMMPMSDEDYNKAYDNFLQGYKAKDMEAMFNSSTKMLMSLTTIIELQQQIINDLESGLDKLGLGLEDLAGELKERGHLDEGE